MPSQQEQYNALNSTLQVVKPPKYVTMSFFDTTIPYNYTPQDNTGASRPLHRPLRRVIASPKHSKRKGKGKTKKSTGTTVHTATHRRRRDRTRQKAIDRIKLSVIVEVVHETDLELLVRAIKPHYTTGRKGYDIENLFVVHFCRYALDVERMSEWLIELSDNPVLAGICGVRGNIPSESTMSRFNKKLTMIQVEYAEFVNRLVDAIAKRISELHATDPKRYPPVAAEVAIDATAIDAYCNPNKKAKDGGKSDKDAQWGKRHNASSLAKGMEWFLGYKMHTIADANYEFPIVFDTTHGKRDDIGLLKPLYESAKDAYPWYDPQYLLGDKGYDSQAMHRYLRKQGTDGIIPPRKPTAKDGLYDGIINEEGDPVCMGKVPMEFVETDPDTKQHLYRCRPEGCRLKTEGLPWLLHCDDEHWFDPEDNPRILGNIRRNSRGWKRLYRKRWSVERVFNSLKDSRLLEKHRYRGMAKVRTHVTSAVVAFLATMLAHLRQNDVNYLAFMKVRRA